MKLVLVRASGLEPGEELPGFLLEDKILVPDPCGWQTRNGGEFVGREVSRGEWLEKFWKFSDAALLRWYPDEPFVSGFWQLLADKGMEEILLTHKRQEGGTVPSGFHKLSPAAFEETGRVLNGRTGWLVSRQLQEAFVAADLPGAGSRKKTHHKTGDFAGEQTFRVKEHARRAFDGLRPWMNGERVMIAGRAMTFFPPLEEFLARTLPLYLSKEAPRRITQILKDGRTRGGSWPSHYANWLIKCRGVEPFINAQF